MSTPSLQDGSKTIPKRPKTPRRRSKTPQRWPKRAPRRPETPQEDPKRARRGSQDGPRTPPGASPEAPSRLKNIDGQRFWAPRPQNHNTVTAFRRRKPQKRENQLKQPEKNLKKARPSCQDRENMVFASGRKAATTAQIWYPNTTSR